MNEKCSELSTPLKKDKGTLMLKGYRGVHASRDPRVLYTQEELRKEMEKSLPSRLRKETR